ncbi:MAG TPA: histidine kinase, partial [Clostridia bacterium]
ELVEIVLKSIERLKQPEIELLSMAAVIGRKFDLQLLFQLNYGTWEKIIEIVDGILNYQFIEKSNEKGHYIFTHDRIRDAFYLKIPHKQRKNLHTKIADYLHYADKSEVSPIIFDLIYHYTEANQMERLQPFLLPAAKKAKEVYAYNDAMKYLDKYFLLKTSEDGFLNEEYTQALIEQAEIKNVLGYYDDVIHICEELESRLTDKVQLSKNLLIKTKASFKKIDWTASEKYITEALKILGEKIPERKSSAVFMILRQLLLNIILDALPPGILRTKAAKKPKQLQIAKTYEERIHMNVFCDAYNTIYNVLRLYYITKARIKEPLYLSIAYAGFGALFSAIPLFKTAEKYLKKSIKIKEKYGDLLGLGQCYQILGFVGIWGGKYSTALEHLGKSMEYYTKVGDLWEIGMSLSGMGFGYHFLGQVDKSIELRLQYFELSKKIGDHFGRTSAMGEIGHVNIEKGEFEKAREYLIESIKISKNYNISLNYVSCILYLGYLELEMEHYEEALSFFEEGRKYDNRKLINDFIVFLYPMIVEAKIGIFIRDRKKLSQKESKLQLLKIRKEAVLAFRKTRSWKNHHPLAYRSYGAYLALTGRIDKAIGYYKKAIEMAKAIERKFELGKGYYELAKLFDSINKKEDADLYYLGAWKTFEGICAQNYIKKLSNMAVIKHEDSKNDSGTFPSWEKLMLERKLKTLLETNKYSLSIINQNELFERVMDSAISLLGAERGFMFLYENDTEEKKLVLKTARFPTTGDASFKLSIQEEHASRSIISRVEEEGKTLFFSDAVYDISLQDSKSILATGVRSVLCSPMLGRNGILGVIYLENSLLGGLFKEDDAGVLELISSQAGGSIEIAMLYQTLREYSSEIEHSRDKLEKWNQTLEQTVEDRTLELQRLNSELQTYALKVEELSVIRERARIARDVHDTLGHTLTLIVNLLSVASVTAENNSDLTKQKLEQAIKIAKDGLGEVRKSVVGLMERKMDNTSFIEIMNKFVSQYKQSGIDVEISVDADLPYLDPQISDVILKICQEGMTNAVRHGNASEISIILRHVSNQIKLFIYDNGKSQKCEIKEGVGLKGMTERAGMVNGKISYGFNGDDGFQIRLEIPLAKEQNAE